MDMNSSSGLHPELLIRPSLNDHKVVEDLLAPRVGLGSRPISRLVLNAPDAPRRKLFSELAAETGTPLVIDPLTTLLQCEVDEEDPWVHEVDFGRAAALDSQALGSPFVLDKLVSEVVEFQVNNGATVVIPPYFYADKPESPEFEASISAIGRTARRLRADGIALPIMPLLSVQLRSFLHGPGWQATLDRFATAAVDVGPQAIAVQFSPVGDGSESYGKILNLILGMRHIRSAGVPTIAWRQGVFGPALVAAGLDGYECGMGIGEQAKARAFMGSRKPRKKTGKGFSSEGVFLAGLGRSLPRKVAQLLLEDRSVRGRLLCDSMRCCPQGADSMMASKGRPHAVRARSRGLQELAEIPNMDWRLHHIGKEAASGFVAATKANEVLARAEVPNRVKPGSYASLEQVVDYLRKQGVRDVRDSA
jgi:hypothetical protein